MDVKEAATFTNYFLICQGNSEPQIEAITESVEEELSAKKYFPHHIEGKKELQWVLMDYDDLIVHVFLPEVRAYYELEKLWGNSQKFNYEDLISRRISKSVEINLKKC